MGTTSVDLPTNPITLGPLLFVPERFLRQLPVLNADDWWSDWQNEQLREDVNYEIMRNVDKSTIVAAARRNPEAVRRWTILKEEESVQPYDFASDPKGVWQWDAASESFVDTHPLRIVPPNTQKEFGKTIETIINQFRLYVEEQGGWYHLWKEPGGKEKPELALQLLFRGIAQHYCKANDISLDAEVNLGRGPVDFKFSNGYQRRVHLEVKKLHNSKFWNGLERQLPSYMKSDEVVDGWFLAMLYHENKLSTDRAVELPRRVRELEQSKSVSLRFSVIDGRPSASASKL